MDYDEMFIAYQGREYTKEDIENILKKYCSSRNNLIKTKENSEDNVIFSKIIRAEYLDEREPYYNKVSKILTVSGYQQDQMAQFNEDYGEDLYEEIEDQIGVSFFQDSDFRLINFMYQIVGKQIFNKLGSLLDFCSVIWDKKEKKLIAGTTNANNEFTHLYYGYTKENKEMIFSNNKRILREFCDDIKEMEKNTYMTNEVATTNEQIPKKEELIKNNRENAEYLFEGLNNLLLKVTNEAVREKIIQNVEEYFASPNPKKQIEDFLAENLDMKTQEEVLKTIKKAIEQYEIEKNIKEKVDDIFDQELEEYRKKQNIPAIHIITLNDIELGRTQGSFYHEKFEQILTQVQLDEPIMLIGPAGSGKNVAVSQVADALGLHMYYTNNASNEFKLTGFIDAGGIYRDTEFYKAFKNGGIFFLDEIDTSDSSALIVINSALANGYMAFPHETINRHKDFRMVAAANTWGRGADLQYVGRNSLDAATLDRFDNIFFDYDKKLEQALYPNEEVLEFMWSFRDAIYHTKIPHVISTRGIGKVYKKEINHVPIENILTSNIIKNLTQDDVNTIIGHMVNIDRDNKYFNKIKRMRLER